MCNGILGGGGAKWYDPPGSEHTFDKPWDPRIYVTGPEKTGLIYTKYTHPYYGIYLFFCVCYLNSVSFIEIFSIYGEIFVKIVC